MPRRNDIAKVLIIGWGPIVKATAVVLLIARRVHIRKLPAGNYVIVSSEWPPNTWWKAMRVDPSGGARQVTLEIPRPTTIRLAAIAGVVFGPGGAALAGGKVAIEKPGRHGDTTIASAQTDATGSFMATLAQSGDYILRVSSPGLHTAIIPIHFDNRDPIAWSRFRLTMKPVVSECGEPWNPYAYEISKSE